MTAMLPNRILREMVDIHYFGGGDGFAARRRMEDLCAAPLTHAVEELLDSWGVPDDQLISIDRLQVNVTGINSGNLESELVPRIVSALSAELEAKIGPAGAIKANLVRPVSRSVFEEVLFFLERGFLPWSSSGDSQWSTVAAEMLSHLSAVDVPTLAAQLKSAGSRQRLVRHFPGQTLKAILPLLRNDPEWRLILADIEPLLQQLPESAPLVQLKELWLRILLDASILPGPVDLAEVCRMLAREFLYHQPVSAISAAICEAPQLRRAFAASQRTGAGSTEVKLSVKQVGKRKHSKSAGNPAPKAADSLKKKTGYPRKPGPGQDSVYIRNGGLVILAAYLPAFFRRLEVADEDHVLDVPTALTLQHYLVFGSEDCAEWDFVLNKILCGVPLEESVETPPPLTTEQKQEADLLLNAVIANWPALKNTSPDALRATFLQREGVLRPKDADWQLLLTRTGFDVLMDRLPWTISMLRLSWMPWTLYTDWAE